MDNFHQKNGLKPRPSRTALYFPFRGRGASSPSLGDMVVSGPFRVMRRTERSRSVSFANVLKAC